MHGFDRSDARIDGEMNRRGGLKNDSRSRRDRCRVHPDKLGVAGRFAQRNVCRNRCVQIPNASLGLRQHCVRDENDAPFCHPERSEGSVRFDSRIRPGKLGVVELFTQRNVCRNRNVQIPNASLGLRQHCVRDDSDAPPCHPEPVEGSGRYVCRIHSGKLGFVACCSTHVAALIKRHVCRWPIVLWRLISAATIGWATRRCHPEPVEGSVHYVCRIHPDQLKFVHIRKASAKKLRNNPIEGVLLDSMRSTMEL